MRERGKVRSLRPATALAYAGLLESRRHAASGRGFAPIWLPDFLYPFQTELAEWAIRRGRAALFADCGLGKTPIQLVWSENVVRHTGGRVLILTPLAVAAQTEREAAKFGIEAAVSRDGSPRPGITITNYERLEHFDPGDFSGCVCDESSILKNFHGSTRAAITRFMRTLPYRLLATATAAPNDYHELGTSSEALGYLGYSDMLARFFANDTGTKSADGGRMFGQSVKWRFKGHAELPFWRWVSSWARAIRAPQDMGYTDDRFALPPLTEREHLVEVDSPRDGMLFSLPAVGLQEQREERRLSLEERCARVAELVAHDAPALVWCHLNREGDTLEKLIPDATQIKGSESPEAKEAKLLAFADGQTRVLVTKPKIGAWGLNFQHCAHIAMFPSHSYEQYYQSIRRCWRYGQTREVVVDLVTTEGEYGVLKNLRRKAAQADAMFAQLIAEMRNAQGIETQDRHNQKLERPRWLSIST